MNSLIASYTLILFLLQKMLVSWNLQQHNQSIHAMVWPLVDQTCETSAVKSNRIKKITGKIIGPIFTQITTAHSISSYCTYRICIPPFWIGEQKCFCTRILQMLEQHWQSFVLVNKFRLSFNSNFFEVTLNSIIFVILNWKFRWYLHQLYNMVWLKLWMN